MKNDGWMRDNPLSDEYRQKWLKAERELAINWATFPPSPISDPIEIIREGKDE